MKAVIYNKKRSGDKLIYGETEKPSPKGSEVLVKIHAVSVNAADYRSWATCPLPPEENFLPFGILAGEKAVHYWHLASLIALIGCRLPWLQCRKVKAYETLGI
jgi:hypothetical protein